MRLADMATCSRVFLAVLAAGLVMMKWNPWVIFWIILLERSLDGFDGYFARYEVSGGTLGYCRYVNGAVCGNAEAKKEINDYNAILNVEYPLGSKMDTSGDRAVEYIFWALYSHLSLVPLFAFFAIIIRHSFVDLLTDGEGTACSTTSRFVKAIYKSKIVSFILNVFKVFGFSYLAFVYIRGWPSWIGSVLIGGLLGCILLRGVAVVYAHALSKPRMSRT